MIPGESVKMDKERQLRFGYQRFRMYRCAGMTPASFGTQAEGMPIRPLTDAHPFIV
jgi:hypothetical protein